MRAFSEYNPIVITAYFLATAGIAMFCMDPAILSLSLMGALVLFLVRNGKSGARSHLFSLLLFVAMALINPIVSHNGVTVLFVVNDNPITLEALIYGIAAGIMIISVLYWFRSFTQIMTSDKLLYVFGALSPKLALILSMALRYIPLLTAYTKKVNDAQKALGLYKDDNAFDGIRGKTRVFSVMVTWALENGIVTADSMTARGYGIGKRSHFHIFRLTRQDIVLLIITVGLFGLTLVGISGLEFAYYPALVPPDMTALGYIGYSAYGILAFMPTIIEVKEALRWRYLKSRI